MTEREQIIEAMARAMDELPTASTMDRMGLAQCLAVAALDAALPMIRNAALREAAELAFQRHPNEIGANISRHILALIAEPSTKS